MNVIIVNFLLKMLKLIHTKRGVFKTAKLSIIIIKYIQHTNTDAGVNID